MRALFAASLAALGVHTSSGYYVCMYQCVRLPTPRDQAQPTLNQCSCVQNPDGTMLDGHCSTSRCQQNPAGICWGGTGSGAFAAEQFSVSSRSDCQGYVDAMLQASPMGGRRALADAEGNTTNTTTRRALQTTGSADSMRNRKNAWIQGATSVLRSVVDCAGHRRAQGDETVLTTAEALEAFHGGSSSRRRLSGCDYSGCESCTSHSDGGFFSSDQCKYCQATGECTSSWFSTCADGFDKSPSDCSASASGLNPPASAMRHCLNRKAASWVVEKCQRAACMFISSGCSPCVRLPPPPTSRNRGCTHGCTRTLSLWFLTGLALCAVLGPRESPGRDDQRLPHPEGRSDPDLHREFRRRLRRERHLLDLAR
eukprot:COSAG04_NODE_1612_length_6166_cov_1.761661_2_plen_369_part_00